MTIHELELEINQFFLDSEKEVDEQGIRQRGMYPNAVLLTEGQYQKFVKELLYISDEAEFPEGLFIKSVCGLKVIISQEDLTKPRVVRL